MGARHESAPSARLAALDVFKGVVVLVVVLIHVSSHVLQRLESDDVRFAVVIVNRALQFAVPAFLFLTALTATRSSLRPGFSALGFYRSKLIRVLVPYLIWSVLYGFFRVATSDLVLSDLSSLLRWRDWLLSGDAYYHLYFLVVAFQFYALFPLVRWFVRIPFVPAVVVLIALQIGAYWLNRLVINSPAPGSLISSYIVVLGLGMLIGARLEVWRTVWRGWRLGIIALAALSLALYLPDAVLALEGVSVDTFAHAAAAWLFSSALALALFGVCTGLEQRDLRRNPTGGGALGLIGRRSFQVYLIHPAVIVVLGGFVIGTDANRLMIELGVMVVAVLVPLVVAWALEGSRLSGWLFGR
jgi:peptidoglycan/LPS O-acetylase OafA/YrhL